jgi:hypothetical protein
MKRIFTITGVMLLLMGSATAFAENSQGCNLQGSWMAYGTSGSAEAMSMVQGQSSSHGTYVINVPGFDTTLLATFPDAVMGATLRGVWTRTGGNTFADTLIGLVVDSEGNTLYIAKLNATNDLAEDCNSMWIESTLELFLPAANPFLDVPFMVLDLPGHDAYRISVDPLVNP